MKGAPNHPKPSGGPVIRGASYQGRQLPGAPFHPWPRFGGMGHGQLILTIDRVTFA